MMATLFLSLMPISSFLCWRSNAFLYITCPIRISLLQESASYLFSFVMDDFTRLIQDEIPWYMLFVDDIVLVDD